jgi:AcrR family transcriptional regulator
MPPRPRTAAQLADRRQSILRQARALAADAGWDAVTMRAVAGRVGLNPPALYEQFPGGKAELLTAVAIEGFGEIADVLEQAATGQDEPLLAIADGYWRFAKDEPALYELMFHHRLELVFATDDTPPQVRRGFAVLRRAIASRIRDAEAERDVELVTEAWWASLHGVVSLAFSNRVRRGPEHARLLVRTVTESLIATIDNEEPT